MSAGEKDYPPRFTISPEGVAGLYLRAINAPATLEQRDQLVELFKMFYDKGREHAKAPDSG